MSPHPGSAAPALPLPLGLPLPYQYPSFSVPRLEVVLRYFVVDLRPSSSVPYLEEVGRLQEVVVGAQPVPVVA